MVVRIRVPLVVVVLVGWGYGAEWSLLPVSMSAMSLAVVDLLVEGTVVCVLAHLVDAFVRVV